MKAIQKYNDDLGKWEYLYNYPMSDEEASKELEQQRKWAKADNTGKKFRVIKVTLA
jgi:hypothetical protein